MDSDIKNKSYIQPKTIAELLPSLSGILSKDAMQTLTAKKAPRQTMIQSRTAEKVMKPLTIAELKADLLYLRGKSPKVSKPQNSTKKRNWNSSVKLENKTKSCTGIGQLQENPVRKVLNFQTKATPRSRQTMISMESNKFAKPESRPKKTAVRPTNNIRISGVCNIQETPILNNKDMKGRMTTMNKENNMNRNNRINQMKKIHETPKSFIQKKSVKVITPLNMSIKSSSDASFLQKEEEIKKFEEKIQAIAEEKSLENIADVSPLVSTPFKEYRNVEQFFNNSNDIDNSIMYNDNTIMSFDNFPQASKKDESVIVSLCDLLNKTLIKDTKTKSENANTELNDLLEIEKQTEQSIKMIESGIKMLNNIKDSHIKSLKYVQKLINEKRNNNTEANNNMDKTLVDEVKVSTELVKQERLSPEANFTRPTVIKMKSPSYKIPKKNLGLRKKVFYKSMPNVSNKTPTQDTDKALDMYMQMKQNMNFLSTPVIKHNHNNMMQPDTPAITSHNLKKQLDKLFNCS